MTTRCLRRDQGWRLGYLLKDSSTQELIQAIRDVYNGQLSLHPAIARKLIRGSGCLLATCRRPTNPSPSVRWRCWFMWRVGYSNQEIADASIISERTVRTHVSNILSKLHLANRTQAASMCERRACDARRGRQVAAIAPVIPAPCPGCASAGAGR